MGGPVTFADLSLQKFFNDKFTGYVDSLRYTFAKITGYLSGSQPFTLSWIDDPPTGTCIVFNNLNGGGNLPNGTQFASVDAGTSLTVQGPNGSQTVQVDSTNARPLLSADGSFLVPGTFTVSSTGGAGIGPFSASIVYPPLPKLVSPANNATVNRANGMTITWTGGDPNGNLLLEVNSAIDQAATFAVQAGCIVPAAAGTFTIPSYVMLALPAGPYAGFTIAPFTSAIPFTAQGLTVGILSTQFDGAGYGLGAGNGGLTLQ